MFGKEREGIDEYFFNNRLKKISMLVIIIIVFFLAIRSITVLNFPISLGEAWDIIFKQINGELPDTYYYRLRKSLFYDGTLPRTIGAIIIGAILGIAGAVMQYCLKNPLAGPYTTGISSAALFGVTLNLALGYTIIRTYTDLDLILMAFVFSLIPCFLMIVLSFRRKTTSTMLILIGISVMYIFTSFTTIIKFNAESEILEQIVEWSIGSLYKVKWDAIPYLVFTLIFMLLSMFYFSKDLDAMSAGDNAAMSWGVNPIRVRLICMVIVSACTSIAICFSGSIGFVGLVVPHISRMFVGPRSRYLIPCSAVVGALLLLVADMISRIFYTQIPVGAVTAVIGAPLFLYFLVKMRSGWGK